MHDGLISVGHGLAAANVLAALTAMAACAVLVARPALAGTRDEPVTSGAVFLAWAYGVRTVPLTLVALAMILSGTRAGLIPVLAVCGAAQLGDAGLGLSRRNTGMTVGSTVLAVVHLSYAWWLATH